MFKKVISIEFGLLKTRICEVDYRKKAPHIYHCISFDTPEGSYYDGYIKDTDALATIIMEKLKEAGIKSKRLVFSLMSTKIANREVLIPLVKKELIQDVIMANVEEYFPMNISEHAITYSILERLNIEDEKKLRLLVLATPDSMVQGYYELAKLLDFEVEAIDYMGNSAYQLVKNHIDEDIAMVVQINEQLTYLNILEKGILTLPRVINYGYMNIIDTLMNSDNAPLSKNEAIGLIESYYSNEEAAIALEEGVRTELLESLQNLIDNIARILDYSVRNENKRIGVIYIVGQVTEWIGLKAYIAQELGIEVIYLDRLNTLNTKKSSTLDNDDISRYISCVGAAIQPVNFVPKDYLEKTIRSNNLFTIIFSLTAGVIISVALILVSYLSYKDKDRTNNILKTEINNLSSINEIYSEHSMVSEQLSQLETIYNITISNNEYFIDLLEDIEDNIPSRAIVDSISVSSEGISLSLVADSETTVAKTLQQLKAIPGLTGVATSSLSISEDEFGLKSVSFVIETRYNPEGLIISENDRPDTGEED